MNSPPDGIVLRPTVAQKARLTLDDLRHQHVAVRRAEDALGAGGFDIDAKQQRSVYGNSCAEVIQPFGAILGQIRGRSSVARFR